MSYDKNLYTNKMLDNVEKNWLSISRFIQPEWAKVQYEAIVESNFSAFRLAVGELEKAFSVKK